ncbi:MAG: DUF262 domain-containing protein [Mycoplasma sp.]|nr:DUF262 domain-containing protein [Mycoplasma sp.]
MLNEKEKNDIEIKQYTLLDLFRTLKYPRIPYFQREYKWSRKQVDELIEDILNFGTDNYYVGSVVVQNDSGKQWIIDGQQRISTFILIINELSKIAKFDKNDYLYELEEHLNEMNFESENAVDKNILEIIVKTNDYMKNETNYHKASIVIERKIRSWDEKKYNHFINNLEHVIFAYIEVNSKKIDESILFEKINSSGLQLSQFDLVKNYLLSKISKEIYNNGKISINYYVSELDNMTNFFNDKSNNKNKKQLSDIDKDKSELIRSFISYRNKVKVKIDDIYEEFKEYSKNRNSIEVFDQLKKFSIYYSYIYNDKWSNNRNIYGPMLLIKKNLNTFITLVVNIFELNSELNEENEIIFNGNQEKKIEKLLLIIESYILRRMFVGLQSKIITTKIPQIDLNEINNWTQEQNLYWNLCIEPYIDDEKKYRMPKFSEVRHSIIDNDLNIYNLPKDSIKIFLFRLGTHNLNNFLQISDLFTIEHVLPQNHNSWYFSSEENDQIEIKKHVLGNLTLTNTNSKLQNQTFISKKKIIEENDGFPLNDYFKNINEWNINEINKRTKILVDEMNKIWNFDDLDCFFNDNKNLLYENNKKNILNDRKLVVFENYNFNSDKNFKTALKCRSHFNKVKEKFTIENIIKIIEFYALDDYSYIAIEENIFDNNFKGWLGQSIIEALDFDKEYDKGRISHRNLQSFLNEKWNDISKLIQFVKQYCY